MHIHIQWLGPYSVDAAAELQDPLIDYGVYQVYGAHPVYGLDVLLYIGRATERCFGRRISEHTWTALNRDASRIKIYVGRLSCYGETPSDDDWRSHIDSAERLLIAAHQPANNASGLNGKFTDHYHDMHILNWGNFRSLLPEVSGPRYSNLYETNEGYAAYGESRREPNE